jgi:hypothetical protein
MNQSSVRILSHHFESIGRNGLLVCDFTIQLFNNQMSGSELVRLVCSLIYNYDIKIYINDQSDIGRSMCVSIEAHSPFNQIYTIRYFRLPHSTLKFTYPRISSLYLINHTNYYINSGEKFKLNELVIRDNNDDIHDDKIDVSSTLSKFIPMLSISPRNTQLPLLTHTTKFISISFKIKPPNDNKITITSKLSIISFTTDPPNPLYIFNPTNPIKHPDDSSDEIENNEIEDVNISTTDSPSDDNRYTKMFKENPGLYDDMFGDWSEDNYQFFD